MKSSFAEVSQQIVAYNKNILTLLSQFQSIVGGSDSSIPLTFSDSDGLTTVYNIPSLGFLSNEIIRLSNSINSIYSIDNPGGSFIATSNSNQFKKIVVLNINTEPKTIGSLNVVTTFQSDKNNFFDGLLDPVLSVVVDLTDKIDNMVRKILVRRYIVKFETDASGNFTTAGASAQLSFGSTFRQKSNISLDDFINWHSTTSGVINPIDPYFDQSTVDCVPNELVFSGIFSVLMTEEDILNKKYWYHLDTLEYKDNVGNILKLKSGDELILNKDVTSSRFIILEISLAASNPRIRVQQLEGVESIPTLQGAIKINSPVIFNKKIKINIGFDERCVLFVKALNAETNILAKDWSLGVGFWTNDLTLVSSNSDNGKSFSQYYTSKVLDYGVVLNDLVKKKLPITLGATPSSPVLINANFKVVQINTHLTDSIPVATLNQKFSSQKALKSDITQLDNAIQSKMQEIRSNSIFTVDVSSQLNNEVQNLINQKDSKTQLLQTTTSDIISLSTSPNINNVSPKYSVRGFWEIPAPITVSGTNPQEVVQFRIQYRYLSKDGNSSPVVNIKLVDSNAATVANAAFSNWTEYLSDSRKRIYDSSNGTYRWEIQDVSSADTPNINQLDIPISTNEAIEIRIKSISEAGFPDSAIESEWSESTTIIFPDNLASIPDQSAFILNEATQDNLVLKMQSSLAPVNAHVNNQIILGNTIYLHTPDKILSGFKDVSGNDMNVFQYLSQLTNEIEKLNQKLNITQGILSVSIFRGKQEYLINSDSETKFNVECEDYLMQFDGNTNGKSGRIYTNTIYVIKDFYVKVKNNAVNSPLGLLTSRTFNYSGFFSSSVPQVFWTNDREELLYSNANGTTNTQLDNQFIWQVNYGDKTATTTSNLATNIGNDFLEVSNNSLTNELAETEKNLGWSDNSILTFVHNNNSLLEMEKWTDSSLGIASNDKLLTTIHPVTQNLEDLVDKNSDLVHQLKANNEYITPINIYFKMNAVNPQSGVGVNYEYIDLNNITKSTRHIKKLKFYFENQTDSKPFVFTLSFNINRNRVSIGKILPDDGLYKSSGNISIN